MKRKDITTHQVLEACQRFHSGGGGPAPWELLVASTGAPVKVVYAAMERECRRGFLEWGVTLRTAWLTEEGKLFLNTPPPP